MKAPDGYFGTHIRRFRTRKTALSVDLRPMQKAAMLISPHTIIARKKQQAVREK